MSLRGLVLAAGMPRSGSTWLYIAVRLLACENAAAPIDVACGWVDDIEKLPDAPVCIVKLHDFEAQLASRANCVVYSYRDVRDAVASMARKSQTELTAELARHVIHQHECWLSVASYVLRYEDMVLDQQAELRRLQAVLDVQAVPLEPILA
jgi:hypothetical protein